MAEVKIQFHPNASGVIKEGKVDPVLILLPITEVNKATVLPLQTLQLYKLQAL